LLLAAGCQEKPKDSAAVGSQAPDFELQDLSGQSYKLSSMKGKVVLLEFWATWCPPCESSVPAFNRLYERFKEEEFVLMALAVDEGEQVTDTLKSFGAENGVLYPVLPDVKNVAGFYNVISIPSTFVIDKEGNISFHHMGYAPDMFETISKEIEGLLKKSA